MNRLAGIVVLLALFAVVVSVMLMVKSQEPEKDRFILESGDRAPAFSLVDVEGRVVRLEQLLGRGRLYLIFWSSSCTGCKEGLQALEQFYRAHKEEGFRVVAINVYQSPEEVEQTMSELELTLPVLLDTEGATVDNYGVYFVPLSYILSEEGRVLHAYVGNPTVEDLEEVFNRYWKTGSAMAR